MPAQTSKHSVTRRYAAQRSWRPRTPGRPLLALVLCASGAIPLIDQGHWSKQLARLVSVEVYAALVYGRTMLRAARAV